MLRNLGISEFCDIIMSLFFTNQDKDKSTLLNFKVHK